MQLGTEPVSLRAVRIANKPATLWGWRDAMGRAYAITLDRAGLGVVPGKLNPARTQRLAIQRALDWENPGAALARMRWSKADADRNQPREAGKLGGRPRLPDRCDCGAMTRSRAAQRKHVCGGAA